MESTTPSARQLRALLPDLALRADKDELLRQLRPLQLDIDPCDPDERMCIRLLNGYALLFTAGDLSLPAHDSWVRVLPVGQIEQHDLLAMVASEALGGTPVKVVQVPVFSAFVRLIHDDLTVEVPTTHLFVENPNAVALVDDAITWCRQATGLPLQWRHLDGGERHGR